MQGLANHSAAQALSSALKALGTHDTGRLLVRVFGELEKELDNLEAARLALLNAGVSKAYTSSPFPSTTSIRL